MASRFASRAFLALVLALLAFALVGTAVASASPERVIADCADDGTLGRSYPQRDLVGALNSLPADLDEYSDCRAVIEDAIASGAVGGRERNRRLAALLAQVGAQAARPEDHSALASTLKALARDREREQAPAVRIDGGQPLQPDGTGALRAAGLVGPLPAPLVGAIAALLALALVAGTLALRAGGFELAAIGARIRSLARRGS